MDEQIFRNMITKIPRTRVPINKSIWMNRYGIRMYLSYILVGSTAFFFLGSLKIFNPYTFNPKQKIYKAHPDYVNGTISFYEKEVDNVVRNL